MRKNVVGKTLLPTIYASYNGVLNVPSTGYSSQLPSLSTVQQSGLVDRAVNFNVPLPLSSSTQLNKNVPTAYSIAQPAFSAPHTHIVQGVPVHSLYALPSVSSLPFETLSPIQSISPVGTLTPVHPAHATYAQVQPVDTLPSSNLVHIVESVKSVKTSSPVQHAVHAVPTVVKSVETLTPVVSVSTVSPLQSVDAVDPIKSVGIVSHQPVETQHSVTEVLKTKSVPVVHISDQQDKQFLGNFFYQLAMMYLPNLSNLRPPSSTSTSTSTSTSPSSSPSSSSSRAHSKSELTTSQPVKVTTPVTLLTDYNYNQESIVGVNNPASASKQVVSVTPANEYVQPTETNGGYVY